MEKNLFTAVYLAGMITALFLNHRAKNPQALRTAWMWYICAILIGTLSMLPVPFLGIFTNMISWIPFSISAYYLVSSFIPRK
ncbi:hypothetical protein K8I31_03380 [bacterium]|nr:hypothetical protein [bacterium]